ncbi:DUF5050 domain-containing protein [Bacillus sp. Marseille-P3661]|uniref:DUF5050 domain-containing protein n=1 Tax=Bacillus sp. Marseille-P3661 TaxID=1936234 RepID=UPI0015E16408|nr:DUF5050 domain-containing protein [Bacillus sp. Marseille-P3661]
MFFRKLASKSLIKFLVIGMLVLCFSHWASADEGDILYKIGDRRVEPGSYVEINNLEWQVVGDNMLLLAENLNINMQFDANEHHTSYSKSDIEEYVNNQFVAYLGNEKHYIESLSLIDSYHWKQIKDVIGNPGYEFWTRSVYPTYINYLFDYVTADGFVMAQAPYLISGVRPVAYLNEGIFTSHGLGTKESPFVLTDAIHEIGGQKVGMNAMAQYNGRQDVVSDLIDTFNEHSYIVSGDGTSNSPYIVTDLQYKLGYENVEKGSYVALGGYVWRVIGDNYLITTSNNDKQSFHSLSYTSLETNNYEHSFIRGYLNGEFYESLGQDAVYVTNNTWNIGHEWAEESQQIQDYVSLISYKEWQRNKSIVGTFRKNYWLRTPVSTDTIQFWSASYSNLYPAHPVNTYGVLPTIVLNREIVIDEGTGTSSAPYKIKSLADFDKEHAINEAINSITTLPTVEELVIEDHDELENSRALVDAAYSLGASESEITNLEKLTQLETRMEELVAAAGSNDAALLNISLNGESIKGFLPDQFHYIVELPVGTTTIPEVIVEKSFEGSAVEIIKPSSIFGEIEIAVTAQNGVDKNIYTVEIYARGNTTGNITNGGLLVEQGDWIYYSSALNHGKLYKINKNETEKYKLSDDKVSYLNIIGDRIYYRNESDGGRIYKIKTDGTERQKLNEDSSYYLNVVGDMIYYSNDSTGYAIYKMKTDGTGAIQLNNDFSHDIVAYEGWIYYTNYSDGGSLYKISSDGSTKVKLNDDESLHLVIDDGWIYYNNYSDGKTLHKMNLKSQEDTQLMSEHIRKINVHGDWIYYQTEYTRINRVKKDGSGNQSLTNYNSEQLFLTDDWLYYMQFYSFMKIQNNGTGEPQDFDKSSIATLSSIKINGKLIENFSSDLYSYEFVLPYGTSEVPNIDFEKVQYNAKVEVIPGESITDGVILKVTAEDGISKNTYKISFSVDESFPTAEVSYSDLHVTNEDVVATLIGEGITVINNGGSWSYTFAENGEFLFEFENEHGSRGTALASVSNIDKEIPTATLDNNIVEPTNGSVEVTLIPSEDVTVLNNEGSFTYEFTENGEFTFEFEDVAGNVGTAVATVSNIDREIPRVELEYSTESPINGSVEVTLIPSEDITVLNNEGSFTYVFTENGEFTFEFEDAAGNVGTAVATVSNIDREIPRVELEYSTLEPTNGSVEVTLIPSEDVTVVNNEGSFTYEFTENGEFTFEFVDAAGNPGTAVAIVNNIEEIPVLTQYDRNGDQVIDIYDIVEIIQEDPSIIPDLIEVYGEKIA